MNKQIFISILIAAITILTVQKFKYEAFASELSKMAFEKPAITNAQNSDAKAATTDVLPLKLNEKSDDPEKFNGKMQNPQACSVTSAKTQADITTNRDLNLECFYPGSGKESTLVGLASTFQD